MKTRLVLTAFAIGILSMSYVAFVPSQPSFNSGGGCGPASGCHTFQSGILTVTQLGNLQVRLTITGNSGNVAGELVDSTGSVVAVNNGTSTNPFTLTAPRSGRYTVNGGFRNPTPRKWDSTRVVLLLTDVSGQGTENPSTDFRLDQNYPNPFNPSTTIQFKTLSSGHVRLTIFDNAGREVAVLVDGWRHFGNHNATWVATNMATGVYFYRLDVGGFSETRKLVLTK